MSLSVLLEPNTKKENWAIINPYRVNTTELLADNLPDRYIINNGKYGVSDFSFSQGSGNIDIVNSIEEVIGDTVRLTISLKASNYSAPVVGGNSRSQIDFNIADVITYPSPVPNDIITGSFSATVKSGLSTVTHVSSSEGIITTPSDISIQTVTNADVSGVDASRSIAIQFIVIYQKA